MSANVTSQISLEDQQSANYVQPIIEAPDYETEFSKLWTAINRLKENKVDVDTFETKIFEIKEEL